MEVRSWKNTTATTPVLYASSSTSRNESGEVGFLFHAAYTCGINIIFSLSMTRIQQRLLALLRIVMGWFFFYAGITKVLNPDWTAAGYIKGAKNFAGFYHWLLQPDVLPSINFLNKWGLVILGLSLILGLFVRVSALFGAALMVLYYLVILDFPYPNTHAYLVDEHIIYAITLLFFMAVGAGRYYGLDNWCRNLPLCKRFPRLRALVG